MKDLKLKFLVLSPFVSVLSIIITKIWTIVEFLLYLFKDNPFTWWSLILLVLSYMYLFFYFFYLTVNDNNEYKYNKHKSKKSKFDERLEKFKNRQQ